MVRTLTCSRRVAAARAQPAVAAAPTSFVHPGVNLSTAQLDFVRAKVQANAEPSAVLKTHTNANAELQTAWSGASWPKAAEIIQHVYGNWPNQSRFDTMLRTVYLPEIINGDNRTGNWDLTMMEASVSISVHLDDLTDHSKAIAEYLVRVPAYIYLSSDGALPKTVPARTSTPATRSSPTGRARAPS